MKDLALWGLLVDNVRRGAVVSVPKLLLAVGTSTLSSSHKTRLQFLCGMSPLFRPKGLPAAPIAASRCLSTAHDL